MLSSLIYLLLASYFSGRSCVQAIINGYDAKEGEFPFVVSLRNESGLHYCGGALLNTRKHILTAAHCLFTDRSMIYADIVEMHHPRNISVLLGTVYSNSTRQGQIYGAEKLTPHPLYDVLNLTSLKYDIGIITLKQEVRSLQARTIELFRGNLTSGKIVTQVGWGVSKRELIDAWVTTPILQKMKNKIINSTECLEVLEKIRDENLILMVQNIAKPVRDEDVICSHNNLFSGSCYRDSGSPVIVDGKVAAVTTFCIPWANNYPDLVTPVKNYLSFIDAEMKT